MLFVNKILAKWLKRENTKSSLTVTEDINLKTEMLFQDYFMNYLKSLDGATRSRTYSGLVYLAPHILNGLGHYKMSQINKTVLKEFINGFTKKTYFKGNHSDIPQYYSQSTIDKVYHLLHGAIKEASDPDGDQLLHTDFMANIKKPRSNKCKAPEPQALTDAEMVLLTEIVNENKMIRVWVHLMLYTCVRPSEPLALKFSDINYEQKTISIQRTLSHEEYSDVITLSRAKPRKAAITNLKNERGGKINFQRRTLKVGDKILNILKDWEITVKNDKKLMQLKRENGTEEYLFCGTRGQFWLYDDYQQVYERLLKRHGLSAVEYNPYRFRHNGCTRLLRLKIDLKTVQLIMGDNTSDMILKVYANLNKDDVLKGSQDYADSIDMALGVIKENEA